MERHPQYTLDILERVSAFRGFARTAALHHERLDGSGYPFHYDGEELDLSARILCVVDIYDAISSDRSRPRPRTTPGARRDHLDPRARPRDASLPCRAGRVARGARRARIGVRGAELSTWSFALQIGAEGADNCRGRGELPRSSHASGWFTRRRGGAESYSPSSAAHRRRSPLNVLHQNLQGSGGEI